jgi:hypothetical protein
MFKLLFEEPGFLGLRGQQQTQSMDVGPVSRRRSDPKAFADREAKLRGLQKRLSLSRLHGNKHLATELEQAIKKISAQF